MDKYTAIFKGDMYSAFIEKNMFSGYDLSIYKARQGRTPKHIFSQHFRSSLEAKMGLTDYLDGVEWSEQQ